MNKELLPTHSGPKERVEKLALELARKSPHLFSLNKNWQQPIIHYSVNKIILYSV